jgi:predicted permease
MNRFLRELKLGFSSLRRAPEFSATIILTMSLTLGALICIFNLSYVLFIKSLPYEDQDRLFAAQLVLKNNGVDRIAKQTYPALIRLYKKQQMFEQTSLLSYHQQLVTDLNDEPRVNVTFTTPEFFDLTQTTMALGRRFDDQETLDSHNPVAVLSYDTWQRLYNGDPAIVGQKVSLDYVSYKVVGVTATGFAEPEVFQTGHKSDYWLAWDLNPEQERKFWGRFYSHHMLIGKLKPGISPAQANQQITAITDEGFQPYALTQSFLKGHTLESNMKSFDHLILGNNTNIVLIMLAAAIAMVLIASANITNLFLSRTAQKQRQMAIKAALGAKRSHLFHHMFAESLILMLISSAIALILAAQGFTLIATYAQQSLPRLTELGFSLPMLAFALAVALLLALFFAALSSAMVNYRSLQSTLQSSGKGSGLHISAKIRNVLIVSQVALAGILLTANINLFQQSMNNINKPVGFAAQDRFSLLLSTGSVSLSTEERHQYINQIKKALIDLPSIKSASTAYYNPLALRGGTSFHGAQEQHRTAASTQYIDADYLSLINLPLRGGRNFSDAEIKDEAKMLIISQSLADELYPGSDAVGRPLFYASSSSKKVPYRIIGVVKNVVNPSESGTHVVYSPTVGHNLQFMLQSEAGQRLNKIDLLTMFSKIDRKLKIYEFDSMADKHTSLLARDIATAVVTAILALLSLFLAGAGIYGVLSYSIKMRSNEFGIRMAIGAKPNRITSMVFKNNAVPVLTGLACSIVIGGVLYLLTKDQISQYLSMDVLSVLASILMILITSAVACYLPLRPIISNRPIALLRDE